MKCRIVLFGALLAHAVSCTAPARAQTCMEGVSCARSGGAEAGAAMIQRFAAQQARQARSAPTTERRIRIGCVRQAGARPVPGGWRYKSRMTPAIDACIAAAQRAGNGGKRR